MRYLILGTSEARDEQGHALPLGGPRIRALLAALALRAARSAPVPVDVLIDEVWADEPPHDAPAALQALVGRLRRVIGKDAVVSSPGGYRLATATPHDDVDLLRFERLTQDGKRALDADDPGTAATAFRQALALWRGAALADLPDRDAAAARPEALRLTALRRRIDADLALGRAVDLIPELRELVADHPLDETCHAQLIRALRAAGHHADALTAYEQVRRILADRLGTDPGAELKELHRQMLLADGTPAIWEPAVAGGAAPAATRGAAPAATHGAAPAATSGAAPARGSAPRADGQDEAPRPASPPPSAPPRGPTAPAPPHHNIRARLTSFVGRQGEIGALRQDLGGARLVTLTGPGGSGKTRLSEEIAASVTDGYPDGVWVAELAPLDQPAAVPGAVLSAVGRRETALLASGLEGRTSSSDGADPTGRLVEYCADRTLLLLLDNCEHVIDTAARLTETLLAHCPGVTVLATSREPLGVPGEVVRPLEPLPPIPAHQLFVERAGSVRPGFDPAADPATAEAVAEICRRLDGLPLAIELAAARLRLLTPRQIADRLDDRFRLLTSGSRTVLPRQQTLRAVVDWSWELLDERERTVLRRASVFAGGWSLAAAEAVCADAPPGAAEPTDHPVGPATHATEPDTGAGGGEGSYADAHAPSRFHAHPGAQIAPHDVLELLGALADKSLLVVDHPGQPPAADPSAPAGEARYRMLETIHEYATERAIEDQAARADHAAALTRHTAWFRDFVRAAEPRLRSAEQLPWLRRVETDLDNIRAALQRSLTARDEDNLFAIIFALGWFWWLRNYRDEGAAWTRSALILENLPDGADFPGDRITADGPGPYGGPGPVPAEVPDGTDGIDPATTRYWQFMDLRLLYFFLLAEHGGSDLHDERTRIGAERIRDAYSAHPGPRSARFPAMLWPFSGFVINGHSGVMPLMDQTVANCRKYGDDWALGVALMFRTHLAIDMPGGIENTDRHWTELRELSTLVGDRWMLAQVEGAFGEIATLRGRFTEARAAYEEAQRLARELGAQTEVPFLYTRLADLALHEGDHEGMMKLVDRSEEEAERCGALDVRSFNQMLRGVAHLVRGEVAEARTYYDKAMYWAERGTLPPQFWVVAHGLSGRILAAEGDRPAGLRALRDTLVRGAEASCTETLMAQQAESAAQVLTGCGEEGLAARLLGAADSWRGRLPRSPLMLEETGRTVAQAAETLGRPMVGELRAEGSALSVEQVIALLDDALSRLGHPVDAGPSDAPDRTSATG
ncbi:LuxR family transcriptional regulator [Streptomyces sp. NA02950]|uniref:AfsR/SARP family transcriptional regulator n=1 Tax=Streptomyces sp. NA02950 TaxID=2742137 RepID=UPI0015918E89|nr:BTAD domain-containing putative transcriptional regulator [Streptomyces sp. NA02950]QKV97677.1 LuxR family transcriptional regulator [Streptomyces sp. NA02950]